MTKSAVHHGHRARKAGARRIVGVAGRPLKLSRDEKEKTARHAVRRRPPLHERLAARAKRATRRLEPAKNMNLARILAGGAGLARRAIVPSDPVDLERREQSGETVVTFVGAVDLVLLLLVVVLLVVGTVMIYSASQAQDYVQWESTSYHLFRQTQWLLVGGVGMYVAMRMDYHRWRHLAGIGLVVSVVMLLLLHTRFGVRFNGADRWLRIGPFDGQPSEFAKMGLILYAAYWFAGQRDDLRHSLRGLVPFAVVVSVIMAMVLKQPDLGTTIVIAVSLFTVYFVSGARLWHLALLAVLALIGFEFYVHHMPHYQLVRWEAFQDPRAQASDAGFQYIQMRNALGTGGISGVGLGNSPAAVGMPEVQTDSIFAILGEEWGVIGTLGILAVFCLFAFRGLRTSVLAPDPFGRLLAAGLTCAIAFQALLNMAEVAGVIPITGVPLPFISYGGSSLSISMVAAGILLNISKFSVDLREDHHPATTYFWRRHRRAPLSSAGGRATANAALSSSQQSAVSHRPSTTGQRSAVSGQRSPVNRGRPGVSARRPTGR